MESEMQNNISTMNCSPAAHVTQSINTQTMSTCMIPAEGIPAGTPTITFNPRTYAPLHENDLDVGRNLELQMNNHTYATCTVGITSSDINDTTVNSVASVRQRPVMSSSRQLISDFDLHENRSQYNSYMQRQNGIYTTNRPRSEGNFDEHRNLYRMSRMQSDEMNRHRPKNDFEYRNMQRDTHSMNRSENNSNIHSVRMPRFQHEMRRPYGLYDQPFNGSNIANNVSRERKYHRPNSFDGKSTDWNEHLAHFELVSKWNSWNRDEMAMQLAMSFTGEALTELSQLPQSILNDYDALVITLTQRFSPKERTLAIRCDFRQRKCHQNESATEFAMALRKLVNQAYPNMDAQAKEVILIDQFISGLQTVEAQRHVQFGHPHTLNMAMSLAEEFESFERSQMYRKPRVAVIEENFDFEEQICAVSGSDRFSRNSRTNDNKFERKQCGYSDENVLGGLQAIMDKFANTANTLVKKLDNMSHNFSQGN